MSAGVTSFKIWIVTVTLNAVFFGIVELLQLEIWSALGAIVIGMAGYIIAFPFWVLTWILLKLIMAFPYSTPGRICWLAGALSGFIVLFYLFIGWILFDDLSFNDHELTSMTGTTIAALIVALYFNRKAFRTAEEQLPITTDN